MAMPEPTSPFDGERDEEFEGEPGSFGTDGEGDSPEAPGAHDELELGDEDVRLPWLEGDDEEEEPRGGGGQIVLLALLAISALVVLVGGLWWFTRDRHDKDLVADGSLITAPTTPYKQKPANPGGKEFEGTGDTSYAVSQGQTRPAQLGDSAQVPKPGFGPMQANSPAPAGQAAAKAPAKTAAKGAQGSETAAEPSGPGVQVGAFSSRASAETAWNRLTSEFAPLKGLRYRIVEGRADFGTVFRLQALPGDMAAARSLCGKLKGAGLDCSVKD